jgi:hypothetical protein
MPSTRLLELGVKDGIEGFMGVKSRMAPIKHRQESGQRIYYQRPAKTFHHFCRVVGISSVLDRMEPAELKQFIEVYGRELVRENYSLENKLNAGSKEDLKYCLPQSSPSLFFHGSGECNRDEILNFTFLILVRSDALPEVILDGQLKTPREHWY